MWTLPLTLGSQEVTGEAFLLQQQVSVSGLGAWAFVPATITAVNRVLEAVGQQTGRVSMH